MKIILIGNKARMGKDTFANMLKEELNERAVIVHFADVLKFICKSYYNWNGEKDTTGRTLLQYVGQSTRDNDEHFWTDFIARLIKANLSKNYEYIIIPPTEELSPPQAIRKIVLTEEEEVKALLEMLNKEIKK